MPSIQNQHPLWFKIKNWGELARQLLEELTQHMCPVLGALVPVRSLGIFIFNIFLYKYTEIENIKSEGLQEKGGDFARSQNERSAQATLTSSLTLWKEQRLV